MNHDEPPPDLDRSERTSQRKGEPLLPPSVSRQMPRVRPPLAPAGRDDLDASDPGTSGLRRARGVVMTPEREDEPNGYELDDDALETPATRLVERLSEARTAARAAVGTAISSAGERMRQAIPQSDRALEVGRTASGEVLRGLQPATTRLARWFHPLWVFVHTKLFRSRKRTGILATLVVIAVLLAAVLPPLVTLSNALGDYHALSSLGNDGLHHLLAAKDDLSGLTSGLSGSTGSSSGLDSLSGLLSSSSATVDTAPYRYEMQRQSGTDYPVTVTVHASPSMATAGIGDKQFTSTLAQTTTFDYGAKATPTPSPTPTPKPSPTPGGSPSSGTGSTSGPGSNTVNISDAVSQLRAANADFAQLRNMLNNPDWILNLVGTIPGTKTRLSTVKALADVGYDATAMGLEFVNALSPVLHRAQAGALSGQSDLITPNDLAALQKAVDDANGYLGDIESRLPVIDLTTLPITTSERDTFTAAMEQLPRAQSLLQQARPWVEALGWALGVGGARHYLVQTLDKEELRASGGFTGNWGVLTIANGKLEPFTLHNVNDIDYNGDGWIFGRHPPEQYSWWPFPNWGLRDSNLSPDYPTMANLNISVFKSEGANGSVAAADGGGNVDGVIQFTTTAIAHVLLVTGPIVVPTFNETITAANVESKIHYYEEDPAGVAIQQNLFPNVNLYDQRKQFTIMLTSLLEDKVKHLPTGELAPLAKQFLADLEAKDVEIYVTNTQIEGQLLKMNAGGAVDTRPGVDGYLLAQSNVSVNKGTPYVQITQNDDVTLDNQGGATHNLTITFYNDPTGPLYGYSTYRDYVRIYTPPQARLSRASGFDTGLPLCWTPPPYHPGESEPAKWANVPLCDGNPYPDGGLSCPAGAYGPGPQAITYTSDGSTDWANDVLGPPTQTTTDLPGRQMWGGYVVVPELCTAKVTLRWYVPHMVNAG